jgi:hypothetical protein
VQSAKISPPERLAIGSCCDATASFAAQRKNVEGIAHIVFSANPKQIRFWLGKGAASVDELAKQYNGCKPCLHGSDAHSATRLRGGRHAAGDESAPRLTTAPDATFQLCWRYDI